MRANLKKRTIREAKVIIVAMIIALVYLGLTEVVKCG